MGPHRYTIVTIAPDFEVHSVKGRLLAQRSAVQLHHIMAYTNEQALDAPEAKGKVIVAAFIGWPGDLVLFGQPEWITQPEPVPLDADG